MTPTETAVKTQEGTAITVVQPNTIVQLLDQAVNKNLPVESMEKLVNLYERVADRLAAQEFADALAKFQEDCPPVAKTAKADIATNKGARFSYFYAPLDEIARTVRPFLHKHGLSYTWDEVEKDGLVTTTCVLRHRNGHRESASFTCPTESANPGMSGQHKNAAAFTYGRRQSLIGVLGLTTTDPDTDGTVPGPISEDQIMELEEAFKGLRVSKPRFFRYLGLPEDSKLSDISAPLYAPAMNFLRAARKKQEQTT